MASKESKDHEPVISAPVLTNDGPRTLRGAANAQRAELLAKRGLAVAAEAVILDVDIQDFVVAYLYYCSAVKILCASLKEGNWSDKELRAIVMEKSRLYMHRAEVLFKYNSAVRALEEQHGRVAITMCQPRYRAPPVAAPPTKLVDVPTVLERLAEEQQQTEAMLRQLKYAREAREGKEVSALSFKDQLREDGCAVSQDESPSGGMLPVFMLAGCASSNWDDLEIARLIIRGLTQSVRAVSKALAWAHEAYPGVMLHTLDTHKREFVDSMPPNVPQALMGDHGETYEFVNHSPVLFALLRSTALISDESFLRSFNEGPLLSLRTTGKSGSFFFTTQDQRYVVKTINDEEHNCLCQITDDYYGHMSTVAASLLVRFFSHFTLRMHGKQYELHAHAIIMENLFPADKTCISETFDLKGSTYKREATEEEKMRIDRVFKDLDLVRGPRHEFRFSPPRRALFIHAIEDDSRFLQNHGIMDYSLLVGVKRPLTAESVQEQQRKPVQSANAVLYTPFRCDEGGFATCGLNDPATEILYIGIIDILQPFNMRKRMELTFKSMFMAEREEISSTDPDFYGERFREFMNDAFIIDPIYAKKTLALPTHPEIPEEPPPLPSFEEPIDTKSAVDLLTSPPSNS